MDSSKCFFKLVQIIVINSICFVTLVNSDQNFGGVLKSCITYQFAARISKKNIPRGGRVCLDSWELIKTVCISEICYSYSYNKKKAKLSLSKT